MLRTRTQIASAVVAVAVVVGVFVPATMTLMAAENEPAKDTSTDWPQWRGPNRNGVAGQGPGLAWPKTAPDGQPETKVPDLQWKFEFKKEDSPGYTPGTSQPRFFVSGHSSPVVADGNAICYAFECVGPDVMQCANLKLTPEGLREMGGGFDVKLPPDLAKAVDAVFKSPPKGVHIHVDWWDQIEMKERQAWTNKWVEDNIPDPADRQKYGPFVSSYFSKHFPVSLSIEELDRLDELIITQTDRFHATRSCSKRRMTGFS